MPRVTGNVTGQQSGGWRTQPAHWDASHPPWLGLLARACKTLVLSRDHPTEERGVSDQTAQHKAEAQHPARSPSSRDSGTLYAKKRLLPPNNGKGGAPW